MLADHTISRILFICMTVIKKYILYMSLELVCLAQKKCTDVVNSLLKCKLMIFFGWQLKIESLVPVSHHSIYKHQDIDFQKFFC